eukprot:scaffold318574_cov28-Tisochrysis_lutea.AAC.1
MLSNPLKGAIFGPEALEMGPQSPPMTPRDGQLQVAGALTVQKSQKQFLVDGEEFTQLLPRYIFTFRDSTGNDEVAARRYHCERPVRTAEGCWIESRRRKAAPNLLMNIPTFGKALTDSFCTFQHNPKRAVAHLPEMAVAHLPDLLHPPDELRSREIHQTPQPPPSQTQDTYAFMMGEDNLEDYDSRKFRCRPFDGTPGRPFEIFCRDFGNAFSREYEYIGDADLTTCMLGLDVGGYVEQDPNADRSIFGEVPMFNFYAADGGR